MGRYILSKKIFNYLENQMPGANGELQLTDALAAMLPELPLCGYLYEGQRFDCGDRNGWLSANLAFAYAIPE